MVYFRITTADGRRYVGSVQGHGGQLGGGAAHCGPAREREVAANELQHTIDAISHSGRWSGTVLEVREKPGHCIVKSVKDWKVPNDGAFNVHHVPLAGATFVVLSDEDYAVLTEQAECGQDGIDAQFVQRVLAQA